MTDEQRESKRARDRAYYHGKGKEKQAARKRVRKPLTDEQRLRKRTTDQERYRCRGGKEKQAAAQKVRRGREVVGG